MGGSSNSHHVKSAVERERIVQNYGKLPLSFEANQGQTNPAVKYPLARAWLRFVPHR